MKRTLSVILTFCLLVGLAVPVWAETTLLTTDAFDRQVKYSVTDSNMTGFGLGFCFTLNAKIGNHYESKNAIVVSGVTLDYEGESCKVTRMGAVVTHLAGVGGDDARMTREFATGRTQIKDVRATKMYDASRTACSYAIRVINIPFEQENALIYARPYVEIEYDGEKVTLYGDTVSASYADKLAESSMLLPYYGADVDGKGRLTVGDTAVLCGTLYLELLDELDEWMVLPQDDSSITLSFYDAAGALLGTAQVILPELSSQNASTVFKVDLPEGTAEVRITETGIRYWTEWE